MIRISGPLDSLFPQIRQALLAATLLHPERWWYLSGLAQYLNVTPSSLQRELAALTQAGILEARRDGNRTYYRPNANCPFLGDLQALFAKTVGLADVLREALAPYRNQLEVAFVYGSIARGEYTSESDIDLMLIGTLSLADVSLALRDAERTLKRPINPTLYALPEFAARLAEGNHFIRTVMQSDKIYLKGSIPLPSTPTRRSETCA